MNIFNSILSEQFVPISKSLGYGNKDESRVDQVANLVEIQE